MDAYVSELEGVLSQVLTARDSQTVKGATDTLHKIWYKRGDTVPALIQIMQVHPEPQMRQLAGVEVRKLLPRFWYGTKEALSADVIEQIKASLLADSLKESNELVRHTVARIISAIARIDLDDDRWPQLMPQLERAARDSDVRQREVSTYVLYALIDSNDYSAAASSEPEKLLEIFSTTLKDPESLQTRVNSVRALSGLSSTLSGGPHAAVFQQFVPGLVEVLGQTVAASDEKSAKDIFESLSELIDADAALLGPAFGELLGHMLTEYGLNKTVDPEMRVAAMRVVATAAVFRYKRINKLKLGPELVQKLVEIVANEEDDPDEDDDEEDEDEATVLQLALQTLETLSARLPPSQVIAPLLHLLPSLVHTSNPAHLRAGYLAFSFTADGAPDFVAAETETLLPWIVSGLQNGNQGVRIAALRALVQLGEVSGDRIGKEHATLIPLVYGILDSAPSLKVCRSAAFALGTILRTLTNETLTNDYLPGLVPRFLDLARTASSLDLKGFVISTIGTAAEVAGRNFLPYFEQTVSTLEPFVAVPAPNPATGEIDPTAAKLVSEALGTLGILSRAVGAEAFAPYVEAWMKTALMCLTSQDAILREMAPLYISELAEVYKAGFAPYVPHIIPHLFEVLGQEEIMYEDGGLVEGDVEDLDVNDIAGLTDGIKVNSALCIEKEFSLDCLGALWQHVPAEPTLMPFFADSLEQLKAQSEHFYEDVRLSAITGLWRMFQALPQNAEVKAAVWEVTTEVLETETDLGVLDSVFDLIGSTAKDLGGAVFPDENALQLVLTNVFEVVRKTHRVFEDFDDDGDDDDKEEAGEESSEAATQLVQTSLELLSRIATVLGAEFAPLFEQVAAALRPYAASKVDSERENGVGAFAELVGAMKGTVSPWTDALVQAFSAALDDTAIGVRSVAAYGVGLLAAATTEEATMKQAYPKLFEQLAALLNNGDDDRALANGAGALARLAARFPDAVPVPLNDVVNLLLTVLPLKEAYEEYPPILSVLSSAQLPSSAKSFVEKLWQQHVETEQKNAVKSVNYLPADDPLGDDLSMQAWKVMAQQLGVQN